MTISIKPHAAALVSAISVSLSALGCTKSEPPTVIMVPPAPETEAGAGTTTPPVFADPSPPSSVDVAASSSAPMAALSADPKPKPKPKSKPAPKPKLAPTSVEGRPFFVENEARVASLGRRSEWNDVVEFHEAPMTPSQRDALIAHFTQWSLAEHASIASFARFGLQLLALGAPPHLLVETTAAMQDEIRHARFGFGVVAALGSEIGPQALAIDGALDNDVSLEHVLRLCVREGMIGETLAALELMASVELTSLPRFKTELASIAEDEARHARLAYSFAAWALARDPALIDVIHEEVSSWECASTPTADGLEQWGIIGAAERRAIHRDGFELAVRPLVAQLDRLISSARP